MNRDHFTHSCDFIRSFVGANVPRGDAAALRIEIAKALDIPDAELSLLLGNYYLDHEDEATSRFVTALEHIDHDHDD